MVNKVTRIGVYGVLIDKQSILLTPKRSGPYQGKLDLPGGKIEFGETIEEALRREMREEVAMGFVSMQLLQNVSYFIRAEQFDFHHLGLLYIVKEWYSLLDAKPEDSFDWYPLSTLNPQGLTPFAQSALK
ncbi:NUDIX domain-containing protein [Candidatus Protochlamydia phocaeensis]|uniref:NUDIX domain-containing protein n=1 Tax=Candidatus Protochlamydia phocaeensis TaxID=1414722 RepID=UPI000838C5AF|nr:NUDIX domain-containing protein [Candidatus Protochlamydia phocaeensis]